MPRARRLTNAEPVDQRQSEYEEHGEGGARRGDDGLMDRDTKRVSRKR